MLHNYVFPNSSDALPPLLKDLLDAPEVGSRNGRTNELCHVGISLTRPWERELLVAGRRPSIAAQIAESAWILAGRNDIDWLSAYLPRAADFSDDGETWRGGYGPRMRAWPVRDGEGETVVDQLAYVVDTLRDDPLSRQAVISLWDPQVDTTPGKDRPCNDWLSFTSRLGKLDLHVALRSNDAIWGWSGINAFEWSVLQEVVAGLLGINIGTLTFSTTSFHLYEHHRKRAEDILTQTTSLLPLPTVASPAFGLWENSLDRLDDLLDRFFDLEAEFRNMNFNTHRVDAFPEPMMRSWLRVLQWWWSEGDETFLEPLSNTRLGLAAKRFSIQPKKTVTKIEAVGSTPDFPIWFESATPEETKDGWADFEGIPPHAFGNTGEGHWDYPDAPPEEPTYDPWAPWSLPAGLRFERGFNKGGVLPGGLNIVHNTSGKPEPLVQPKKDFVETVIELHNVKHAAYGDSWKRRGEMLGILANIARKIDRLGGKETYDETTADTAIDLLVYLAKMRTWLYDQSNLGATDTSDTPHAANRVLREVDDMIGSQPCPEQRYLEGRLRVMFEQLEAAAVAKDTARHEIVDDMIVVSYRLARHLFDGGGLE